MTEPRTYGWRRDSLDRRDKIYSLPFNTEWPPVPDTVDMQPNMPGVYNQGAAGSCTGNGIAGAIEYRRRRQKLYDFVPSRLFIYWNERVTEGTTSSDAGAQIRDGIKSVVSQGVCPEDGAGPSVWPYNLDNLYTEPPQTCYDEAKKDLVKSYSSITKPTIDQLKSVLFHDYPIVFGFMVYEGFENIGPDGICPLPHTIDVPLGGHCVIICGYDHPKRLFKCRNSYGKDWGLNGYFWMPYDYITNSDLCDDFWVIETVS
jgi:C1A family cysteine protease